jgi:hypothetical protein
LHDHSHSFLFPGGRGINIFRYLANVTKKNRKIEPFASEHLSSALKQIDFGDCDGVLVRSYSVLTKQQQEGIVFSFVLYYKKEKQL